jgi:hypothetical protein
MQSMWSDGVLSDRDYMSQFGPEPEEEEEPEVMYQTEEEYIAHEETIARSTELRRLKIEARSTYQDGGELRCGVCGGTCFRHHYQDGQVDVGECCTRKAA